MQCSCCRLQRATLHEYSLSALDADHRKTIQTLYLCAICRIVYAIKPHHVLARARQPTPQPIMARRLA